MSTMDRWQKVIGEGGGGPNPKFKPMIVTEVVVMVIGAFPLANCAESKIGYSDDARMRWANRGFKC